MIAGQGTIGLEIIDDLPDVDLILTPVGGGGTYTFRARFRQSKATVAAGTVNLPVVITVTYS